MENLENNVGTQPTDNGIIQQGNSIIEETNLVEQGNLIDQPFDYLKEFEKEVLLDENGEVTFQEKKDSEDEQPNDKDVDSTELEESIEEKLYKVKVSGEEIEVPESELILGYQRQEDYTRKTQALAHEHLVATEFKEKLGFDLYGLAKTYISNPEQFYQDVPFAQPSSISDVYSNLSLDENTRKQILNYVDKDLSTKIQGYDPQYDTDHKIQRDLAIENAIRFVSKKQIETQQLAIQENERKQAEFREEINRNALFDRISLEVGYESLPEFKQYVQNYLNNLPAYKSQEIQQEMNGSLQGCEVWLRAMSKVFKDNKGTLPKKEPVNVVIQPKPLINPPVLENTTNNVFSNQQPKKQIDFRNLSGKTNEEVIAILNGQ